MKLTDFSFLYYSYSIHNFICICNKKVENDLRVVPYGGLFCLVLWCRICYNYGGTASVLRLPHTVGGCFLSHRGGTYSFVLPPQQEEVMRCNFFLGRIFSRLLRLLYLRYRVSKFKRDNRPASNIAVIS